MTEGAGWNGGTRNGVSGDGLAALRNEVRRLWQQIGAMQRGAALQGSGITARTDGLLINSKIYFTTDTGGNIEPAEMEAFFNGTATAVRLLPPHAVGFTPDDTGLNLQGVSSGSARGNAHLIAGNQLSMHAGGSAFIDADQNAFLTADDQVNITAGTRWALTTPGNTHRLQVTGNDIGIDAPSRLYLAADLHATGNLSCAGTKPFVIDHPLHEDKSLVHVATETPIAAIEYPWPEPVTLDENGQAELELPDYFEALAADDYRAVWVQAIGRPFPTGADLVVDGKTTVYGDPGRQVFVRITARRGDQAGQFDVEIPRVQPPTEHEEMS